MATGPLACWSPTAASNCAPMANDEAAVSVLSAGRIGGTMPPAARNS